MNRAVLLLAVLSSVSALPAVALKLVEQKPAFDSSVLPKRSRFELGVKYSRLLSPQDGSVPLRSGTAALAPLSGSASLFEGAVEKTLTGTEINTREHGVSAPFHLDLFALIPKIAPDINLHLDLMRCQPEKLRAAKTGMPPAPAQTTTARIPERPAPARSGSVDLMRAIAKARPTPGTMPASGHAPGAMANVSVDLVSASRRAAEARPAADYAAAMKAQQRAARNRHVDSSLDARLDAAHTRATLAARDVQPNLAAISTQARRLPSMPNQAADPFVEQVGNRLISWDAWHKQFATLAGEALLRDVNKIGGPVGVNTVSITVRVDGQLSVALVKSGNARFDSAVLLAYRSLAKNPALAFPPGSVREAISFLVDNAHESAGSAVVVNSTTCTGDNERVHANRR